MLGCYFINSESHDLEELKKMFRAAMDLSKEINIKKNCALANDYLDMIAIDDKIKKQLPINANIS